MRPRSRRCRSGTLGPSPSRTPCAGDSGRGSRCVLPARRSARSGCACGPASGGSREADPCRWRRRQAPIPSPPGRARCDPSRCRCDRARAPRRGTPRGSRSPRRDVSRRDGGRSAPASGPGLDVARAAAEPQRSGAPSQAVAAEMRDLVEGPLDERRGRGAVVVLRRWMVEADQRVHATAARLDSRGARSRSWSARRHRAELDEAVAFAHPPTVVACVPIAIEPPPPLCIITLTERVHPPPPPEYPPPSPPVAPAAPPPPKAPSRPRLPPSPPQAPFQNPRPGWLGVPSDRLPSESPTPSPRKPPPPVPTCMPSMNADVCTPLPAVPPSPPRTSARALSPLSPPSGPARPSPPIPPASLLCHAPPPPPAIAIARPSRRRRRSRPRRCRRRPRRDRSRPRRAPRRRRSADRQPRRRRWRGPAPRGRREIRPRRPAHHGRRSRARPHTAAR